jgi:hypothetical protein
MKFEIDFSHMPQYVVVRTHGKATIPGFEAALSTLVNSPQWQAGTNQLVDHSKLQYGHFTSQDMRAVEGVVQKYGDRMGCGRCAFIVSDKLGYGLVRMYELLGGDNLHAEVRIFHTPDEAVRWLTR